MDWCESPGMIWPQSNDSIDLLTQDEKLEGMEVLARTCGKLKTTALCLGVQGRDTDEMLVYAKHARALKSVAIISRPPDNGKTQEDLRQYWRALAEVVTDRPVMIQTTARTGGISPSKLRFSCSNMVATRCADFFLSSLNSPKLRVESCCMFCSRLSTAAVI
jgi:hypothetical protein